MSADGPQSYLISEANYAQMQRTAPVVAVLPWGACEAHNYHMPYGTDIYLADAVAAEAGRLAHERGAAVGVLPAVPFGGNEQQLDQHITISMSARTQEAVLDDVCRSLRKQHVDRLVILNAHGGNDFISSIRDLQGRHGMLIVAVNYWQMLPDQRDAIFDDPGAHAGELETSLMLHLHPRLVQLDHAGPGQTVPFDLATLKQPGVRTPSPWHAVHPDTGDGDPSASTAEKGAAYLARVAAAIANLLVELAEASPGDLPYLPPKP